MASTGSSTSGTTTTGSEIISSVNKKSGSGIDLKSLVTGLVNAETAVAQSQITKKVESTNLAISAFGTLTSKLDTLNTDLTTLKAIQRAQSPVQIPPLSYLSQMKRSQTMCILKLKSQRWQPVKSQPLT